MVLVVMEILQEPVVVAVKEQTEAEVHRKLVVQELEVK